MTKVEFIVDIPSSLELEETERLFKQIEQLILMAR